MASFLSFLKKTMVCGLVVAVTTMSVYSALMSSYLYMVPSEMGVCALREYHLGLESRWNFYPFVQFYIGLFYKIAHVPSCQFHPLLPTAWINWLDTPAQKAIPFSTFSFFVANIFARWLLLLGTITVVCWVVYAILRQLFRAGCRVWNIVKENVTPIQLIGLIPLLAYAGFEGQHYAQETFRMLFVKNSDNFYTATCLFAAWFFTLNGAACREFKKTSLRLFGSVLVFVATFGPRLFMFNMIVGLAIWYYSTTIISRIHRRAQEGVVRPLALLLISALAVLTTFDERIGDKVIQVFRDMVGGEMTSDQAKRAILLLYKKMFLKYHPDRNPAPTAATQFQKIKEVRDEVDRLLKHPYADVLLEVVGEIVLSVNNAPTH